MGDKGLDAYLNQQVKTLGKAVDDIYSGKTPFKGYVPSGPQDYVNPTYAIRDLIVGNQPGIPPSKKPQKAYDFQAELFAIKEYNKGQADQVRTKNRYAQIYNYNTDPSGGAFYDRYSNWQNTAEEFDKIGFHPLRDNEANFNAQGNSSFINQAGLVMNQTLLGVTTGVSSMVKLFRGDMFGQNGNEAEQYARNSALGNSTKKGIGGFMNNLVLNFGYTAGIMSGALGENLIGMAMGAFSKSVSAAKTLKTFSQVGKGIAKSADDAIDGGKVLTEGLEELNDLNNVRTLHNATQPGKFQKFMQSGVVRTLNPLSNTTDLYYDVYKATDNISGLAKNAATFSQTAGALYRDLRTINLALSESRLEGGMVENTVADKLYDEYFVKHGRPPSVQEQYDMQEQARHAGFETAVFNSGLIYITNKITFGNILNPRYASQGIFGKSLRDFATIGGEKGFGTYGKIVFNNTKHEFELIKNNFKTYIKGFKTDTFANTATKTVGYLKANVTEGFQENAQEVISKANENYYLETYKSNAVKSQLYSRALFGVGTTPLGYYGKEVSGQFSPEGRETFFSGFFMGVLGGGLNTSAQFLYNSGNKIFKPKQYEEYKKQKEELTTGMVAYLNKFGAKQYMDSRLMTLGAEEIATNVIGNGTKKEILDTESENLVNHMTTLLERGGFANFIDSFESFLEETDAEFEDSFKTIPKGEAPKYKARLRDTVAKAREIEKRFNHFKLKYPNPINLEEFDKDDLDYDQVVLMHEAWNLGVKNAVFYGESYDDTQKRMVEIIDKHYEQRPLQQLSKRDSDIIMDVNQMGQEIKYLETEITGLAELKDPDSKALAKEKGKKLAALKEYKEAHTEFDLYFHRDRYIPNAKAIVQKRKGKDAEVTDKEIDAVLNEYLGEVNPKGEVALLKTLKAKYNKLMTTIGDTSNGVVFDSKLDESFKLVLDFYKLNDEGKKLASQINLLNDPKAFVDIYNNNYAWMQKMYLQKSKYYESVIKEQLDIIENNALLNSLADEGIYMSSEDFVLFLTNQIPPTEFFDQAQGLVIPEGSQAYERYYAKLKQLQDLKTDDVEDNQTDLRQRIETLKQRKQEAIRKRNTQFKNELKIETGGKTEEDLNREDNLNENVVTAEAIDIEIDMLKGQKELIKTSIDIEDLNDLYANFIERELFTEEEFNEMQDNITPAQKTKAKAIIKELKGTIEDEGLKNQIAISKVLLEAAVNNKLKTLADDVKTAPKKGERSVEKTKAWADYQTAVKKIENEYNDLVAKARALTKEINKENAPKDPVIIKESYDKKLKDLETKKQKEIDALEKEAVRSNVKNIIPEGKNKTLTIFEIAEALAIDEYVEVNYKGSKEVEPLIFYKDANGDLREGDAQGEVLELDEVPVVFTEASKFNYEQKPNQEQLKKIEAEYKVLKDAIIDTYNDDKQVVDEVEDFAPITPKSNLNTAALKDFRNMLYEKYALENEEIPETEELDEQKFKEWYSLPENKVYFDTYNKSEPSSTSKKDIVINFDNAEIDTEGLELPALIEYRDKINDEITTFEEENLTTTDEKLKQENKDDIRALRTNLKSLNGVIEQRQFDNFSPKIQQSILKIQKLLNDQKGVEPGVLLTEDDEVTGLKKGQKAYRINGKIHRRTTNVIQEVIEDDYSYDGVKEIQKIFDLTIAKKGLNSKSIEEFISGLEDLLSVDSSKLPGINSLLLNQIKKELKSLDGKSIKQINLEKEQKKISDQIDSINKKIVKFDELGEDTKVQNLIGQRNELTPILAGLDAQLKGKASTTTDTVADIEKRRKRAIKDITDAQPQTEESYKEFQPEGYVLSEELKSRIGKYYLDLDPVSSQSDPNLEDTSEFVDSIEEGLAKIKAKYDAELDALEGAQNNTGTTTDTKADIERKTTKVISSEIVEKGNRKGQTRTVTQTNSVENVDGTLVSVTEYEAKVGDTIVSLGGRKMTFKEFKEEFPLDEDYEEIFAGWPDLNDDTIITVRKVKRTSTSSRFSTVVDITSPVLGGKMDITIEKDDTKYNAELAALGTDTKADVEKRARVADIITSQLELGVELPKILETLAEQGYVEKINNSAFFKQSASRDAIVFNIDGAIVPIYRSSKGTSSKTKGEWYPFFFTGGDWLVKAGTDTYKDGYNNPIIKQILDSLNKNYKYDKPVAKVEGNNQQLLSLLPLGGLDLDISDKNNSGIYDFQNYVAIAVILKDWQSKLGNIDVSGYQDYLDGASLSLIKTNPTLKSEIEKAFKIASDSFAELAVSDTESKPSTKNISTEPVNVNTTFDIIMHMITEESFEDGRIAGNLADDAKDYLESGKKLPFNEKLITPEAYKSLFEFLNEIKKEVDEGRMYLIGRDLVVYDSDIIKADEKKDRIAGEIDLLVATEEGIMIIDIKTGTVSKWKKFNAIKKDKNDKVYSKREEYTLQQGVYATMLEKQIDAPVVGIMLLPIERTSDPVTNKVTSISEPTAKSVFTKLKYKKDAKGNYIRNEGANKLEFEETTETPSKWFIPLYRDPIQDKLDILIPPGTVRFIPGLNDAIDRQMSIYIKLLNNISNKVTPANTKSLDIIEKQIYEFAAKNGIKVSNEVKDLLASKKLGLDKTTGIEGINEVIDTYARFTNNLSIEVEKLSKSLGDIKFKISFNTIKELDEDSEFIKEQLEIDPNFKFFFDKHASFAGRTSKPSEGQLEAVYVLNASGILTDEEYAPVKEMLYDSSEVSDLIHEAVKRIHWLKVNSESSDETKKIEQYQKSIWALQAKITDHKNNSNFLDLLLSIKDTISNEDPQATIIKLDAQILTVTNALRREESKEAKAKLDKTYFKDAQKLSLTSKLNALEKFRENFVKINPFINEEFEDEGVLEDLDGNEKEDAVKIPKVGEVLYFKNDTFDEYTVKEVNKNGLIVLVDQNNKEKTVRLETINKDYLTEEEMMSDKSQDEEYVPTADELKLARESVNSVDDFVQKTDLLTKEHLEAIKKTPEQIRKELITKAKLCP